MVCRRDDFDQEEKARFGALCSGRSGKGREWFAKYVSAQVRARAPVGAAPPRRWWPAGVCSGRLLLPVHVWLLHQPVSAALLSPQRCHSKRVSEATFYRLVRSFAVVLFE